jgi:hypothetical protein
MNIKPSCLVPNDPEISQMIEIWKGYNEDRHMLMGIANQTKLNELQGEEISKMPFTKSLAHFCRVIYPPKLV